MTYVPVALTLYALGLVLYDLAQTRSATYRRAALVAVGMSVALASVLWAGL